MTPVHLVTVVGGHIDVLGAMLAHYRAMGIESIFLNLHLSSDADPVRDQVGAIARKDGCGIASITVGDWQNVLQELYLRQREQHPNDWFLLADQDELQVWPGPVVEILNDCDSGGWDHVRGCFVDRHARDGGFPEVRLDHPLGDLFPLGSAFSAVVLDADPRKVVAAKGALPLKKGQHHAYAGRACPARQCYVPVHHFKWTRNTIERLAARAETFLQRGLPQWTESARFINYYREHDARIDLTDPRLLIGECVPDYPHWEAAKKMALRAPVIL